MLLNPISCSLEPPLVFVVTVSWINFPDLLVYEDIFCEGIMHLPTP